MTLVGLDVDATRARAVSGPAAQAPQVLRLAEPHGELVLALDLQGRQPVLGRAALGVCRRLPDCACVDFLPHLGGPRQWRAGRHRLDAERALALVLDHLARGLGKVQTIAAAVPAYLSTDQVAALARLADKAHCRLSATAPTPLAAALGAHEYLPWSGQVLVLDVDGHALTWSALMVADDSARLLASQSWRHLGRGAWLSRLLDGVADRCVRLSRRDPRESAEAEQYLYDQLLPLVEGPPGKHPTELVLQSAQWYQRFSIAPGDFAAFCAPLAYQVVVEMKALLALTGVQGPLGAVLLAAPAAGLPGLTAALQAVLCQPAGEAAGDAEDLGAGLLPDEPLAVGGVHVLPADAVARGAHELAACVQRGQLRAGVRGAVPLPVVRRTIPPRLHAPDDSRRTRLPFRGDGVPGDSSASAAAPLPAPRRRPRPHEE
jgi:hypothetical protein